MTMLRTVLFFLSALFLINPLHAEQSTAPVSGFARSFIFSSALSDATITVNETGQHFTTNDDGHFGPFNYPIGKPITLTLEKWGYKTTQSATVILTPDGANGPYSNITFQVPSIQTFFLLSKMIGATVDDDSCHLTATITQFHKTMDDIPQGIAGAEIVLTPSVNVKPFYFDIITKGPLANKTYPFSNKLTQTSEDGGVAVFNLPPRAEPYTLTAKKPGVKFSKVLFLCKKGVFINLSPPQGPTELTEH
jgi:hypothetical protein